MFPFNQIKEGDKIVREFKGDVDPSELIWHQDREDRTIKVIEANGWGYQLEKIIFCHVTMVKKIT